MKTYYKNDLKKAQLILEGKESEREDYQAVMLQENEISGILKTEVRYVDNQSQYYYDISGKTSFKILHEKINLSYLNMKGLVSDLLQAIQNVQKYMLNANCILLEPEFIFCEGDRFFFCYYPPCEQEPLKEFHKLTEFFVREVNYKDEEGVHFAYTLHKATMEDNYSIEEIMKKILPEPVEETEEVIEVGVVDYTQQMEERDEEEDMIEEKNTLWGTVRRFLEKAKLIYVEDEEEDL